MQLILVVVGFGSLGVGVLISMRVAQRITNPLGRLVDITIDVAKGNLNQKVDIKTKDEVEVLAHNFSHMIKEIKVKQNELEDRYHDLRRLQRYTDKLITTMEDGLLTFTPQGDVVTINPAAEQLLADKQNTLVPGMNYSIIADSFPELQSLISKVLAQKQAVRPMEIQEHSGMSTLLVSSSILYTEDNTPNEYIFTLHDITEIKDLEAQMRQSQRLAALGTLAAGLAHEIRNPLASIMTFVKLLPKKMGKPSFMEKFQRTVPREATRIADLVEDLLELSRIPKYEFEPTNMNELIKETLDLVSEDMASGKLTLQFKPDPTIPTIPIDSSHMKKALLNLVINAIQAMDEGGKLSITTLYDTDLLVTIDDTGHGIPKEIQDTIFDPFYTTKDKGTGLGLSITHKIIMEHGGNITIEPKKGPGVRFVMRFFVPETRPEEAEIVA